MNEEHSRRPEFARLLAQNERFADQFKGSHIGRSPLLGLAILTCMDARIAVEEIFGLRPGDANVIRDAGAVATDDAIRSLIMSQWLLRSNSVIVLGHTGCGLQ